MAYSVFAILAEKRLRVAKSLALASGYKNYTVERFVLVSEAGQLYRSTFLCRSKKCLLRFLPAAPARKKPGSCFGSGSAVKSEAVPSLMFGRLGGVSVVSFFFLRCFLFDPMAVGSRGLSYLFLSALRISSIAVITKLHLGI